MPTIRPRAGRDAVAEVYADLEPLLRQIAARFVRRYGGDRDEALADANLFFLEAYHGHDPARGKLETRVQFVVWNRLVDRARREAKARARLPFVPLPPAVGRAPAPPAYEPDDWGDPDAQEVVDALTGDCPALDAALRADPDPTPTRVLGHLRAYLDVHLGWDSARVRRAINEVGYSFW